MNLSNQTIGRPKGLYGRLRAMSAWNLSALILLVGAIVLTLATICLIGVFGYTLRAGREAIMRVRGGGQLGEPADQVIARCEREWLLDCHVDQGWLVANTPMHPSARNWLLYVDFADGQVTGLRVRIEDSYELKPDGGPPDVPEVDEAGSAPSVGGPSGGK